MALVVVAAAAAAGGEAGLAIRVNPRSAFVVDTAVTEMEMEMEMARMEDKHTAATELLGVVYEAKTDSFRADDDGGRPAPEIRQFLTAKEAGLHWDSLRNRRKRNFPELAPPFELKVRGILDCQE